VTTREYKTQKVVLERLACVVFDAPPGIFASMQDIRDRVFMSLGELSLPMSIDDVIARGPHEPRRRQIRDRTIRPGADGAGACLL